MYKEVRISDLVIYGYASQKARKRKEEEKKCHVNDGYRTAK